MRRLLKVKVSFLRKFKSFFMLSMISTMAVVATLPLLFVFFHVLMHGASSIDLDFFTNLPAPVGEKGGGMANAIWGSIKLVGFASLAGIPLGIVVGIYLSEYGYGKLASLLRFATELLTSVPSIIVGLYVFTLVVAPMGGFSTLAGSCALAIIIFPIVSKTTEEVLKLMPVHIREAGLALGIPRWRVILSIVVKGSLGPITTGIMLAVARVAGETAPLLFTAFGNSFWSESLFEPVASLPVQIYTYAISPFEQWQNQAWGGALVLVLLVFILNLGTRLLMSRTLTSRSRS